MNNSPIKNETFNVLKGGIVVVDTSSLLMTGVSLLQVLPSVELVIPAIVIQELENKRNHNTVGYLAREWLNFIEKLRVTNGRELSTGVTLSEYPHISLKIEPNHSNQTVLPVHLQDNSNDSTILAVAKNFSKEEEQKSGDDVRNVYVLSNDVPMRIHATLDVGLEAVEYNVTQVTGAKPFDGRYKVIVSDEEYANAEIFTNEDSDLSKLSELIISKLPENRARNAFVELFLNGNTHEGDYVLFDNDVVRVNRKTRVSNIVARTLEQDVALELLTKPANELPIVSLGGGAGTGKTLLTIGAALDALKSRKYQKVIVFRSLHEMGQGQEMGFLPGNVDEKMAAWAGAILDALDVIAGANKTIRRKSGGHAETALQEEAKKLREMIEISPITYLRGRSLANTYIVLEEAQNFSRNEILNILSRVGEGSKVVLTFDAAQVDNKFLQTGPKSDIWSVIDDLKNSDLFAHITLLKTERSRVAELASTILEG